MDAKAGEYRRPELPGIDVTISARYHRSGARQLPPPPLPPNYIIGISGILPYHRNVTLQTLDLCYAYVRLYNAAASPASRLRSAGSLAINSSLRKKSEKRVTLMVSLLDSGLIALG